MMEYDYMNNNPDIDAPIDDDYIDDDDIDDDDIDDDDIDDDDIDDDDIDDDYIYIEKKRRGCLPNGLKVGCGFILGIICTFIFSGISHFTSFSRIQYFNEKGKATIHLGMPKDSVILLLGEPTEFTSSDYRDEIKYRYGFFNTLHIEFRKGKVIGISKI